MTVLHSETQNHSAVRSSGRIEALLPVVGGDLQVPLATGGSTRYANLDYAASAPALQHVCDTLEQVSPWYASVHRGAGWASQVSTALYEGARQRIARFLGARADDTLIFTRNTTDALNLLARAVPASAGDVVVLDLEHHANLLPWQRGSFRLVPIAETFEASFERLAAALAERPTALLAVTGASNVTGEELPVARLAELAHAHGARIVVDAAQLAPHRHVDIAATGVDYLALSGHKLYAPHGTGVLLGRSDWLDGATPYLAGGGAVRTVGVEQVEWANGAARHEAGTPNVLGAVALAAACDAIDGLPGGAWEVHESALRDRLVDGLEALKGVRVVRIWDDSPASIGVVTFVVDGFDPGLLAAVLSAEYGIGVRDGKFCAHPLLARLDLPGGAVRASLGLGSSSEDVDRLVQAIETILASGPTLRYELVAGRYAPVADGRCLPSFVTGWLNTPSQPPSGASPCQGA